MSSVEQDIAEIEREILALTANQPPSPSQIPTFSVDHTTTVNNEIRTIVFDDGNIKYSQVFSIVGSSYLFYDSGFWKVKTIGTAGKSYKVISLARFSLA